MRRWSRVNLLVIAVFTVIIASHGAPTGLGESGPLNRDVRVGVPMDGAEPARGATAGHSAAAEPSRSTPAAVDLRYDLDQGLTEPVWDAARTLPLIPRAVRGGALRAVPRDGGRALAYPPPCLADDQRGCPTAVLQSPVVPWLNPRDRDVRWGARVLLRAEQTTDGENIVQKGRSTYGTQFKLQVDHRAGLASCVVAGLVGGENRIFVAQYVTSVADGRWHALDCERLGAALTLRVDGVVRARVTIPATLAIANDDPLRLGGKGVGPGNDQFHGILDDVYVTIG